MTEGWIKLYRILRTKPIWKKSSPPHKVILITLLLMANHKENEWEWQGQKFKVNPGQFITSLDSIVEECKPGITIQNVRSALQKFEKKYQFLTNESTKTGRLITIANWEIYQGCDDEPTKQSTENQQRGNKEVTPNKNDKNVKNDKKDIYSDYTSNSDLLKAFDDFEIMRNKIKKPMSDRVKKMLINELNKLADTDEKKIAILEQSIFHSWQGVFPLREDKPQIQGQQKYNPNNFTPRKYDAKALEESWIRTSKGEVDP